MTTEKAVLAGGCFWGTQDIFRRLRGVVSTRVGYTGGDIANLPGLHDPTTYEQQGSDFGPSYRSAIFYTDEQQKETALATIDDIEASGLWPGPVVTEINPEERFWQAEPGHQDYLQRHPGGYSCHFIRPSWRLPSAQAFRKSRTAEGPETDPPLAAMVRGSLSS